MSFAHLHLHTEFSMLDGLGRINDYMSRALQHGMRHIAITDHGVMYGVLDFYKAARANNLQPIIGVEGYLAPHGVAERDKPTYHLLLLAETETGYHNLIKLSSRASLEGFYRRPRMDFDMLAAHSEGLICTTACLGGPVANPFLEGQDAEAERWSDALQEIFGREHYFIEVQDQGLKEQPGVNRKLVDLAKRKGLPLVATNDVHYVDQADAAVQDLLVCIQTNTTLNDPRRMRMESDQFYLKSAAEMAEKFGELPESLSNTIAIAERCNFELDFSRLRLPVPEIPDGMTAQEHLAAQCWNNLPLRYDNITDDVRDRLQYELDVIESTGFGAYILIVQDFADFARSRQIAFGVRGSAAASIVLYALGITDIDPLANRLVFERFLNLERREMPDIDMDFADNRRAEVIEYVAQKYGHDRVAQIVTFGSMGAKASLRDVGRAMAWAPGDVDRIARLVPTAVNMTLDRALAESAQLRTAYESESNVKELIDTAKKLEGISRHAGTHAAGVVISAEPLTDVVPIQRPPNNDPDALPTTQFSMENVAEIGLLKMDFLGLVNLTILSEAVEIIKQTRGESLDPKEFPDGDEAAYAMLAKGETFGVFQLESSGMRRAVQELRPNSIAELSALVALYRPGPMQHISTYCRTKHGQEELRYPHDDLAELLDETYGVIVYQDQVLLIAQRFAGYTLGEADIMRKAMGKKIPETLRAERERFRRGAQEKGYSQKDADRIFDLIEPFAGYAFNKAHAVCYGTIAYQTAYLKANYPAEYMTAVLRLASGHGTRTSERVAAAIAECGKLGIAILPPSINHSSVLFEVEQDEDGNDAIRYGLSTIKNMGESVVQAMCAERVKRDGAGFVSLYDLCASVNHSHVNKRTLESLIKGGALDELGDRTDLLNDLDRSLSSAASVRRAAERGQMGLFAMDAAAAPVIEIPAPSGNITPRKQILAWEREYLGVYLSDHPLAEALRYARSKQERYPEIASLEVDSVGDLVTLLGLVSSFRIFNTRDNRSMASCWIEDLTGTIEVVFFPNTYERIAGKLQDDQIVVLRGRVSNRDDVLQLAGEDIDEYEFEEVVVDEELPRRGVQVNLTSTGDPKSDADRLEQLARLFTETFAGDDDLYLRVGSNGSSKVMRSSMRVDWCPDLRQALGELIGDDAISEVTLR